MKLVKFILIALLVTSACKAQNSLYDTGVDYPELSATSRGDLLHYEEVTSLLLEEILDTIPEAEYFDEDVPDLDIYDYVHYSITLYRVYYSSTYKNKDTVLSGLVMVPDLDEPLAQYQYHHGTTFPYPIPGGFGALEVPSLYPGGGPTEEQEQYDTRILMNIPAAAGYLASAPDYAGYSISQELEHPYVLHDELAKSSLDLLVATRALAEDLGIEVTGQVFLGGWSEGGGATLATHQLIEEEAQSDFTVAASAPFAGPYNFSRFMTEVIGSTTDLGSMSIYNWGLYVLNQYAEAPMAADNIWSYPVNDQFDALDVPSYNPQEIFQTSFIEAFLNGETPLNQEAINNNLHEGWNPKGNIYFHSGKTDDIVPHFNSVDAYEALKLSSEGEVVLYEYEGDHYTPVINYLFTMLDDFEALRK